jgi:hypothetical protein
VGGWVGGYGEREDSTANRQKKTRRKQPDATNQYDVLNGVRTLTTEDDRRERGRRENNDQPSSGA